MKVILLCAGYATRLYPLTLDQPKPLLPIGRRPILEWILNRVKEVQKVDSVFLVTNHRFAPHFEKWSAAVQYPWPIRVVDDQTTTNENRLGAIGDLYFVLKTGGVGAEDLLVIAGDNLFGFDLQDFVARAEKRRPHAAIAVYDVMDRELAKQYGLVQFNKDGEITGFFEKPKDPPVTYASCGLYWLPAETRVLLDRYLQESDNADQPGHYMRWLTENDRLYAFTLTGFWFDIGDLASYQKANELSSTLEQGS
ncbi:MAG: nucleotidyltransferase family protein [Candidatus Omnitrophica bacterium]|nr:nucleotidyltransferase family protein [Candidatus Omnitrophota bacterium]